MSPEAAHELSVPDIIHALNEKISVEWSRLLETPIHSGVSVASVQSEVRAPWSVYLDEHWRDLTTKSPDQTS